MKISVYQDRYNALKTWKVESKNKAYYLTQFINGEQFGKVVKMTQEQIAEIGIFDFVLLSCVECEKVKFIFSTPSMSRSKTILACNYDEAKKKAREYLNVKRLPSDYYLTQVSHSISDSISVDIK